jgi:hypothetical protein
MFKPLDGTEHVTVQQAVDLVIWLAGRSIECSFFRRIQDLINKPDHENIEEVYEYIMIMLQCLIRIPALRQECIEHFGLVSGSCRHVISFMKLN